MWRQLLHPNILPFLGVDAQTFAENDLFGMVSPWMQRGTLMQHLSSSEYDAHKHREQLVRFPTVSHLRITYANKVMLTDYRGGQRFKISSQTTSGSW